MRRRILVTGLRPRQERQPGLALDTEPACSPLTMDDVNAVFEALEAQGWGFLGFCREGSPSWDSR